MRVNQCIRFVAWFHGLCIHGETSLVYTCARDLSCVPSMAYSHAHSMCQRVLEESRPQMNLNLGLLLTIKMRNLS